MLVLSYDIIVKSLKSFLPLKKCSALNVTTFPDYFLSCNALSKKNISLLKYIIHRHVHWTYLKSSVFTYRHNDWLIFRRKLCTCYNAGVALQQSVQFASLIIWKIRKVSNIFLNWQKNTSLYYKYCKSEMTYLDVNDPYFSPNTCRNQPVSHAKAKMLDMSQVFTNWYPTAMITSCNIKMFNIDVYWLELTREAIQWIIFSTL